MSFLIDTHYHLEFLKEKTIQEAFLKSLEEEGIRIISQSTKPSVHKNIKENLEDFSLKDGEKVMNALGFHPWHIASEAQAKEELVIFDEYLDHTSYIGEIGLDFVPKRLDKASQDLQEKVFHYILEETCKKAEKLKADQKHILSIHAVWSAERVIDILEEHRINERNVLAVIHWFSGTSDELTRHIRNGGYISVNPMMLEGKKGRAYVKQIPADRILLETDLPEEKIDFQAYEKKEDLVAYLIQRLKNNLEDSVDQISEIRQENMKAVILQTQEKLGISK